MTSAGDVGSLCAGGYWIELGNAVNIESIEGDDDCVAVGVGARKKALKQRAILDETIHVEHGRDTKVPIFQKFEFVYRSKAVSRAAASLSLPLSKWCKLCALLSKESNWESLDQKLV
ncbi:hypothetical protein THAOC_11984, partial [Thalassiosira oceanica]